MVEVFKYYAKCNKIINAQMIEAIGKGGGDLYNLPSDGYFKSIGVILEHIYGADSLFFKVFSEIGPYPSRNAPVFAERKERKEKLFDDLKEFAEARTRLDDAIVQLASEIKEEDLPKTFVRTTRSGEKQERIFWKALMHVFNHETHHRGQIAQILDQLKVQNDYSNMIRIE